MMARRARKQRGPNCQIFQRTIMCLLPLQNSDGPGDESHGHTRPHSAIHKKLWFENSDGSGDSWPHLPYTAIHEKLWFENSDGPGDETHGHTRHTRKALV
eukprot:scaffold48677_cov14-Tisochrysis_lutea.AAC.1